MPYWKTLAAVADFIMTLARELALKEGVDPVEFDAHVIALEDARHTTVGSILAKLKGMLGKA